MERAVLWCFLCFAGIVAQNPPTTCTSGKYGVNCELKCSENCKAVSCDRNNGHCTNGCNPGWSTPTCSQPCNAGWYGEGCATKCSDQCAGDGGCNKVNGACPQCKPGYWSSLCDKQCKAGFYGQDCQSECGKCKTGRGSCDHINGECPRGCAAGFKSALCTDECAAGEWGENCQSTCSQNCQNSTACDKKTGYCPCVPGYRRSLCTDKCKAGYYGQDCLENCGQCRDGPSDCHHVTGGCTLCKDNWELPLCQRCIPGKFGTTCSLDCGACGGDGRCDRDTGLCLSASCQPGWKSSKCDQKCPPGSYGENCTHQCGACGNGSSCRHDNGVCQQDCEEGFEGVMCQRETPSLVGPVVGAVVAAGILIAIAIVFSVWLVKCRGSRFKPMPTAQSKEDFPTMAEMATVDPEDVPPTPGTSEVYQNMLVNHVGPEAAAEVNPAANYDRVDMAKRAEEVHHYEVHTALQREAGSLLKGQQDDPLYQNTNDAMASPAANQHQMAPEEPEATYGNV